MQALANNHALITGGSRGIGATIAQELCSLGARVTLLSRNEVRLKESVKELNERFPLHGGNRHDYIAYDLSHPHDMLSCLRKQHWNQFTSANILINCAGLTQTSLLINTPPEQISDIINVNLVSPILLCKFFAKNVLRSKNKRSTDATLTLAIAPSPAIVNISSVVAEVGGVDLVGSTVYTSSKAGLSRFTDSLRAELRAIAAKRPGGVAGVLSERLLCVQPGLVAETAMGRGVVAGGGGGGGLRQEGAGDIARGIARWLS
jgi:3-oxoacyl-[acyl-carrier protein] reductase